MNDCGAHLHLMIPTHMAYGFVLAYFLSWLLSRAVYPSAELMSLSGIFVIFGVIGGLLPDIDRLEQFGMSHRKTLHYPTGYLLLALLLTGMGYFIGFSIWITGFSLLFFGAWLHSAMDILDSCYGDLSHGVYEHITKKWIRPRNWIDFASPQEWSAQSICFVLVVAISPFLGGINGFQGWMLAFFIFFLIWLSSTLYEVRYTVPKRQEMERRLRMRG